MGWYDSKTKRVVIRENCRVDTVLHELGWHATLDWAREQAQRSTLYDKMMEYARNAPEAVKQKVRELYPELQEGSEGWLDEVGAWAYSQDHYGLIDEMLKTPEERSWWQAFKDLFTEAWRFMMRVLGRNNVDLEALSRMDYRSAMNAMAEAFVAGKSLNGSFMNERARERAKELGVPVGVAEPVMTQKERAEIDEIIRKAKENGTYLKAPNGKKSNLSPRQWAQVRTKAFKKWFGDWEKAARLAKLRESKAIEISGKEVPITGDWKADLKAAQAYAKKFRGEYVNKDTGKTIPLFGRGVNELSQHDVKDNAHLQSFAAIPKIIQNGIYIDTLPNEDANSNVDAKAFEYYVCGLKINGEDYTVKAVVAVGKNGERYYDHKLTQIEKGALLSMLTDISKPEQKKAGAPSSGIKDKRLLSLLQANSSKVVDESGEPQVVYHGSNWNPLGEKPGNAVFKHAKVKNSSQGVGFYFTGAEALAWTFGQYSVDEHPGGYFLNLRNTAYAYGKLNILSEDEFYDAVEEGGEEGLKAATQKKLREKLNAVLDILRKKGYEFYPQINQELLEPLIEGASTNESVLDYLLDADSYLANEDFDSEQFRTDLRSAESEVFGIDGWYSPEYADGDGAYVAFSPEQIKSATDNTGAFDGSNPDIRFQRDGAFPQGEVQPMGAFCSLKNRILSFQKQREISLNDWRGRDGQRTENDVMPSHRSGKLRNKWGGTSTSADFAAGQCGSCLLRKLRKDLNKQKVRSRAGEGGNALFLF